MPQPKNDLQKQDSGAHSCRTQQHLPASKTATSSGSSALPMTQAPAMKNRFHIYSFEISAKIRLAGRMAKPKGLFSIVNAQRKPHPATRDFADASTRYLRRSRERLTLCKKNRYSDAQKFTSTAENSAVLVEISAVLPEKATSHGQKS